jgi:hypothetical protein
MRNTQPGTRISFNEINNRERYRDPVCRVEFLKQRLQIRCGACEPMELREQVAAPRSGSDIFMEMKAFMRA